MTMGIWTKDIPLSPDSINEMIDNMEAVKKLAMSLRHVWCNNYLLIDYTEKTFWGDDIHPMISQGLTNLGFTYKK